MGPIEKILRKQKLSAQDEKPVWFMRQAGRVLPRYLKLREKYSFHELMRTPQLAAEVTMLPMEDMGVNGAILFSDILVIPEALGMDLIFTDKGPRFTSPLNENPNTILDMEFSPDRLNHIYDAIEILDQRLSDDKTLIGFCGAPLTVFCYMIQGLGSNHDFPDAINFFYTHSKLRDTLLRKITDASIVYALNQIKHGAKVFQLFDTWAGILPQVDFNAIVFPYVKEILQTIRKEAPVIYFPRGLGMGNMGLSHSITDGLGCDWQTDIRLLDQYVDEKVVLQGNLDPRKTKAGFEFVQSELEALIQFHNERTNKRAGHIFNLGHGVIPGTKLATLQKIVKKIQSK